MLTMQSRAEHQIFPWKNVLIKLMTIFSHNSIYLPHSSNQLLLRGQECLHIDSDNKIHKKSPHCGHKRKANKRKNKEGKPGQETPKVRTLQPTKLWLTMKRIQWSLRMRRIMSWGGLCRFGPPARVAQQTIPHNSHKKIDHAKAARWSAFHMYGQLGLAL